MKYFEKYFKYQSPSFLAKDSFKAKNNKLVNNINYALIDLRNAIIIGAIPVNENPNKIVDIVKKIFDFNKQQKCKGLPLDFYHSKLKILSPKQMLQRLPIALAQVKAGNRSENLKSDKSYILCIEKKKLLIKYTTI